MDDPSFEQKPLTQLEYGEIDDEGAVIAWHLLQVQPDGTVDLQAVPNSAREKWERFGISLPLLPHPVFPRQGQDFLVALLQTAGPYRRIRIPSSSV